MLTLTKQYRFSAAHRLWRSDWGEAQNKTVFGLCSNIHGHNYTLDVSVTGEVDPETGMIIPLPLLDRLVEQAILTHVDHHYLEQDVAFLASTLTTVENLVAVFYHRLTSLMPEGVTLVSIRLYECEMNSATYSMNQMR